MLLISGVSIISIDNNDRCDDVITGVVMMLSQVLHVVNLRCVYYFY